MVDKNIWVVIPAYNESKHISEVIKKTKKYCKNIIVVDDGSKDNTSELAKNLSVYILKNIVNMGKGSSLKTGCDFAIKKNTDIIIVMDADGQHDPADIAKLLENKDNYDMVVGARSKGSKTSLHRDLANFTYNSLASYVTKFRVQDLTSGFRLIKNDTIRKFIYLLPNTFSYPSTITLAYLRSGRSIKYVPIKTQKRKGKSKIKLFQDGVRFFLIITKIATLFSPFRVFLPVSLFFFLTGILYYLYTYIVFHRFTNMSALLLSSSIIIFMIGLVSEQISQMRYDRVED